MQPVDDKELAAQAADGDINAFGGLFERYARDVFRVALALGHRHPDAEDLMQDTFIAAWEGIGRFQGRSSIKTWLTAILLRQASRNRRRAALRVTAPLDARAEAAAPERHEGDGTASRLDVHAMLESLSEEHRHVLVLRELQGLSYDEIAHVLEVPRGTVESRLFRARTLLRERFHEYQIARRTAPVPVPVEVRHD